MRYLIFIPILFMVGCATTPQPSYNIMELEQQRLQRLDQVALTCDTDLCRVMVAQEQGRNQYRPAAPQAHPAWRILDRTLSIGIPYYFGAKQVADLAGLTAEVAGVMASVERSDNSITVGGNLGDTDNSQNIGGNLGDTRGDEYGSFVGGDNRVGDDRIGDDIGGDAIGGDNRVGDDISGCVGAECRITSPGPIDASDSSDNSDNSDNSVNNPPVLP